MRRDLEAHSMDIKRLFHVAGFAYAVHLIPGLYIGYAYRSDPRVMAYGDPAGMARVFICIQVLCTHTRLTTY